MGEIAREAATTPEPPGHRTARVDRAEVPTGSARVAPEVTPSSAVNLQRRAGNRAVTRLARQSTGRVLARKPGEIAWGSFAARVGGKEEVIQVVPWNDQSGNNNNMLVIKDY